MNKNSPSEKISSLTKNVENKKDSSHFLKDHFHQEMNKKIDVRIDNRNIKELLENYQMGQLPLEYGELYRFEKKEIRELEEFVTLWLVPLAENKFGLIGEFEGESAHGGTNRDVQVLGMVSQIDASMDFELENGKIVVVSGEKPSFIMAKNEKDILSEYITSIEEGVEREFI